MWATKGCVAASAIHQCTPLRWHRSLPLLRDVRSDVPCIEKSRHTGSLARSRSHALPLPHARIRAPSTSCSRQERADGLGSWSWSISSDICKWRCSRPGSEPPPPRGRGCRRAVSSAGFPPGRPRCPSSSSPSSLSRDYCRSPRCWRWEPTEVRRPPLPFPPPSGFSCGKMLADKWVGNLSPRGPAPRVRLAEVRWPPGGWGVRWGLSEPGPESAARPRLSPVAVDRSWLAPPPGSVWMDRARLPAHPKRCRCWNKNSLSQDFPPRGLPAPSFCGLWLLCVRRLLPQLSPGFTTLTAAPRVVERRKRPPKPLRFLQPLPLGWTPRDPCQRRRG